MESSWPRTADGDAFRFRAGRSSLDLCATLLWRHGQPRELLTHPADVATWLAQAGLCSASVAVTSDDLALALGLREAVYRLITARLRDAELPAADVAVVNAAAAHPERAPQLTPDLRLRWISHRPVAEAFAAVARDCIELLAGDMGERLRECAAPDCAFLFVDTSRPGTRRWCATNRCGNREHVRQHRSRQDVSADGSA